jgi:hypothetical protein
LIRLLPHCFEVADHEVIKIFATLPVNNPFLILCLNYVNQLIDVFLAINIDIAGLKLGGAWRHPLKVGGASAPLAPRWRGPCIIIIIIIIIYGTCLTSAIIQIQ